MSKGFLKQTEAQVEAQVEAQTEAQVEAQTEAQVEAQTEAQAQTTDATDLLVNAGTAVASEKLVNLTNSIKTLNEIQKRSDYSIAFALNLINKHHKAEIKEIGYKNVEEYAYSNFDYSKSTFHNYVKIAERFITPRADVRKSISSECFEITTIMTNDSFTVLEDIDGYSFSISQMLEMLPLTDKEIEEHLEEFSTGDTTKTIRNKVNAIRSAIVTTATETGETPDGVIPGGVIPGGVIPGGAIPGGAIPGGATSQHSDDTSRILAILEIVNKLENDEIRNKLVELLNSVINS